MRVARLPALLLLACWSFSTGAAFDPTDVVQPSVTFSLVHDDNLFRLPGDLDPTLFGVPQDRVSDTTRILGVGLKLDKRLGRQRLLADLNLSESTYDNNPGLDNLGGEGRLSWFWQLGNLWSGELAYRKRRSLAGFADFRFTDKDLIDSESVVLTAGYQFHPRWRVSAELGQREWAHSAVTRKDSDFNGTTGALVLTYRTPAGNSVGVQARRSEGNYPNRTNLTVFDNNYAETEGSLLAAWRLSGSVALDGRIGHTSRQYNATAFRDFSGLTWRGTATWEPTAKMRLALTASKDLQSFETSVTSHVIRNALSLSPAWAITSKFALQGDVTYEIRDFRGDPTTFREDSFRLVRLGVLYSPIKSVDLTMSYEIGDRRSNQIQNQFEYQSWFGTARLKF